MDTFLISELEERAGVTARTIREYIRRNLIERPEGRGFGTAYTELQLLQAVSISRMRAARMTWDEVAAAMRGWSLQKLRAYVKKTDPPVDPPAAPPAEVPPPSAPTPLNPPALGADAAGPAPRLPHGRGAPAGAKIERDEDASLPAGPRWVLVSLLPGMALMVRDDAPPVVRRAAGEIIDRYAAQS